MKHLYLLMVATVLLAAFFIGCDRSTEGNLDLLHNSGVSNIILPPGAVLQSATLYIYVNRVNGQQIDIHRVTNDWAEATITWNNFGGAYDPTVITSFTADALDWRTADITGLVQDWMDGTYPNYGILIDQVVQTYPRGEYNSREATTNHPYVLVCYTLNGEEICEGTECIADAFFWELEPDWNFGSALYLATGWIDEVFLEKQSVLRFTFEAEPGEDGCSHTIGYWKTHAGFGPQADVVTQYLPIWLGEAGGDHSMQVTTAAMAVDVLKMKTYGAPKNGITKLYAQLLGAKLSIADGASGGAIADEITQADALLAMYDWTDWKSLSKSMQNDILQLMSTFDSYNNGYIGPGHCDEFDPDQDYED